LVKHGTFAAILAAGFRARTLRVTQFRSFAIKILGVADAHLKSPLGPDQPDRFAGRALPGRGSREPATAVCNHRAAPPVTDIIDSDHQLLHDGLSSLASFGFKAQQTL
jgi:hypothetical protein